MSKFLKICIIVCSLFTFDRAFSQERVAMPGEDGRTAPINYEYFPSREYAFVWRNWSLVDRELLADVMQTSVSNVEKLAQQMGLPAEQTIEEEWSTTRGYITILRRNWHLLTYDQLTKLIGMSHEELKYRLNEDDFLYEKLGSMKPYCEPLLYSEPTAAEIAAAEQFRSDVAPLLSEALHPEEPRFGFMREFDKVKKSKRRHNASTAADDKGFEIRMIAPYFADYGEPLLDKELTSYPEELFRRLQEVGVNGVWLHSVLRTFVEAEGGFPGDERAMERREGLQRLVDRAAKYDIKIYLYLNEPRALHKDYFYDNAEREALAGPVFGDLRSFCTSKPEVLDWMSSSLESLFRDVEGLGGVFTITASENYTSCASRPQAHADCELCREHSYADLIVGVNSAIERGVHAGNPDAKVICWDWGWPDNECEEIISRLPKSVWFMAVSEWGKPIERGGIKSTVGEYSLSAVGPGPRALRNWAFAREAGLKTLAKVQVNASWEMSVVSSVPVLDLIARHADNLSHESVNGVMLSWSLGGYPSENLKLFQNFQRGDIIEEELLQLAREEYGEKVAPQVREAWRLCSDSFENYPFSMNTIYSAVHHMGPSNPIFTTPTNYRATYVVGVPYDDLYIWRSFYPTPIYIDLLDKSAAGFKEGVALLDEAQQSVERRYRKALQRERGRMEAVRVHLQAGVEQGRFIHARNLYLKNMEEDKEALKRTMSEALKNEKELITSLLEVSTADSSIGYESSSQYFYVPLDLLEAYASACYAERWVENLE